MSVKLYYHAESESYFLADPDKGEHGDGLEIEIEDCDVIRQHYLPQAKSSAPRDQTEAPAPKRWRCSEEFCRAEFYNEQDAQGHSIRQGHQVFPVVEVAERARAALRAHEGEKP